MDRVVLSQGSRRALGVRRHLLLLLWCPAIRACLCDRPLVGKENPLGLESCVDIRVSIPAVTTLYLALRPTTTASFISMLFPSSQIAISVLIFIQVALQHLVPFMFLVKLAFRLVFGRHDRRNPIYSAVDVIDRGCYFFGCGVCCYVFFTREELSPRAIWDGLRTSGVGWVEKVCEASA
jgi:hypothetical protein